jgi:uncharacterized protein YqjF (DUF2071 family)
MNLRTYVRQGGKAGVWFFSLDAGQKLAVRVARRFFHLPYFDARFEIGGSAGMIDYSARRTHRGSADAAFSATYRPCGEVFHAVPGTLESFLTDIHHDPWPLQPAEVEIRVNTLGDWLGLKMSGAPETLWFSRSLDVKAWMVEQVPISPKSG